jgi:hypothetical protein
MPGLYWHVHHDMLFEFCWNVEGRINYIKNAKPQSEVPTRLRLMQPIKGSIGNDKARAAYIKARAPYDKAWAAYDKAWAAYDKAGAAYDKARAAYIKARAPYDKARAAWLASIKSGEVEALHAIECPNCPWNGRTIFPEVKKP